MKISEMFEGENSSLRKTYGEAVRPRMKMEIKIVNKKDKKYAEMIKKLLDKEFLINYPKFEEDVINISSEITMFKIKYGIDIKSLL